MSARYDRGTGNLILDLGTGRRLSIPARTIEGLADVPSEALEVIEIGPAGLGLHWPQIDVDAYVPGLLEGVCGSLAHAMARSNAAPAETTAGPPLPVARNRG